jgi:hypothetical protein
MPSKFMPLPAYTVERLKELPQRMATLEGLLALWFFGSLARDAWTPISKAWAIWPGSWQSDRSGT